MSALRARLVKSSHKPRLCNSTSSPAPTACTHDGSTSTYPQTKSSPFLSSSSTQHSPGPEVDVRLHTRQHWVQISRTATFKALDLPTKIPVFFVSAAAFESPARAIDSVTSYYITKTLTYIIHASKFWLRMHSPTIQCRWSRSKIKYLPHHNAVAAKSCDTSCACVTFKVSWLRPIHTTSSS